MFRSSCLVGRSLHSTLGFSAFKQKLFFEAQMAIIILIGNRLFPHIGILVTHRAGVKFHLVNVHTVSDTE